MVDKIADLFPDTEGKATEANEAIDSGRGHVTHERERIQNEKEAEEWYDREEWAEHERRAMHTHEKAPQRDTRQSSLWMMLDGPPLNSPVDIDTLFDDL